MKKIGIVILNYLNYHDTFECVDSLLKQKNADYQAVIVDNHSANESFTALTQKYQHYSTVDVIQTSQNLGYAKGNNTGIVYLKEKYDILNVLVLNNDTVFIDSNYLNFLQHYPIGTEIGAVGTRITGKDGLNQNPRYDSIDLKRIFKDSIYFTLEAHGLIKYYHKLKEKLNKNNKQSHNETGEAIQKGKYFLHGSSLYLTENYLKKANGFYPDTFLYYEENILAVIMEKLALKMVYDDSQEIYHKEDQSSAMSFNNVKSTFTKYLAQSVRVGLKVKLMNTEKILNRINSTKYNRKESDFA